jgi:hypothetical protein
MPRWIRRFVVLVVIGVCAAAASRLIRARRTSVATFAPSTEWPPFERQEPASVAPTVAAPIASAADAARITGDGARSWVPPVDGGCPDGYPIKANTKSHIFHVPGGQFYARTVAERCYATAEDAERDGYRRAKA